MNIDQLIREVEEAADAVYTALGEGHSESVYEATMGVELRFRDILYEVEKNVEIIYRGVPVGMSRLDLYVDQQLVVELKAVSSISKGHASQVQAYMRTLGVLSGLVVNFGGEKVTFQRFSSFNE